MRVCNRCKENLPSTAYAGAYYRNCMLCNELKFADELYGNKAKFYLDVIQSISDKNKITQMSWEELKQTELFKQLKQRI